MRRQAIRSLWPYLGLLICLFALSVAAPRSWRLKHSSQRTTSSSSAAPHERGNVPADGTYLVLVDPGANQTRNHSSRSGRTALEKIASEAADSWRSFQKVLAAHPLPRLPLPFDSLALDAHPSDVDATGAAAPIGREDSSPSESPSAPTGGTHTKVADHGSGGAAKSGSTHPIAAATAEEEVARLHFPRLVPATSTDQLPTLASEDTHPPQRLTKSSGAEESTRAESTQPTLLTQAPAENGPTAAQPTEPAGPVVRISDLGDRLAMRLRPESQAAPTAQPTEPATAAEMVVATDQFKWLQIVPTSLLEALGELAGSGSLPERQWASRVGSALEKLTQNPPSEHVEILRRLDALERMIDEFRLQHENTSSAESRGITLLGAAVSRRVAVWRELTAVEALAEQWQPAGDRFIHEAEQTLALAQSSPEGRHWAKYLMLEELIGGWRAAPSREDRTVRYRLIEQFADRLESTSLTKEQQALLHEGLFARLKSTFGDWAASCVDIEILCKAIEAHEASGGEIAARRLAADARLLSLSSDPAARRVAAVLEANYRSANLRVAVTRELLQRLLPPQPAVAEPVRETIAGASVAGQSVTETDVRVLLIPDDEYWRIGLEVSGDVSSSTSSSSGPATFHSAGHTEYLARKLIALAPTGLYSFPAVAGAEAENMLRALDTSFDGIPLVEGLIRSIVINQHEINRSRALAEVESKVATKARQRLDAQTDERLQQIATRVRRSVLGPLVSLNLRPEAMRMATTENRLTAEVRLASDLQLAAHTPRPYALGDSLMSVQVHDSVLNNLIGQLELADRELTLPALYEEVANKLGHEGSPPADLSETASIRFASRDPVAVSFDQGRLRITLAIKELKDRRNRFYNFKVHANYQPHVDGLHGRLFRDGIIEIEGRSLRPGEHIALQCVFVSLFSDTKPFTLVPAERNTDPRLSGLMITQLVLEDGWLGASIGPTLPARTAQLTR